MAFTVSYIDASLCGVDLVHSIVFADRADADACALALPDAVGDDGHPDWDHDWLGPYVTDTPNYVGAFNQWSLTEIAA